MKALQKFSKEYLEHCRAMKPEQIIQFLEDFQQLHLARKQGPLRLISLKVPEPLLSAFRLKAEASGMRYQTQIKKLMQDWLGD